MINLFSFLFSILSTFVSAETTTTLDIQVTPSSASTAQQTFSPYLGCINAFHPANFQGRLQIPVTNSSPNDRTRPVVLFGNHGGENGFFVIEADRPTFNKVPITYNSNNEPYYKFSYESPTEPGLNEYAVYVQNGIPDYARRWAMLKDNDVHHPQVATRIGQTGVRLSQQEAEKVLQANIVPFINNLNVFEASNKANAS